MERKLWILRWALATYFLGQFNFVGSKPLSKINLDYTTDSPNTLQSHPDENMHLYITSSNGSEIILSSDKPANEYKVTRLNNKFSGHLYPNLYEHNINSGDVIENSSMLTTMDALTNSKESDAPKTMLNNYETTFSTVTELTGSSKSSISPEIEHSQISSQTTVSSEGSTELNPMPNPALHQNDSDHPDDSPNSEEKSSLSSTNEWGISNQSFDLDSSQSNESIFTTIDLGIHPGTRNDIILSNSTATIDFSSTVDMPTDNDALHLEQSNDISERPTMVTMTQSRNDGIYTEKIYSSKFDNDLLEISETSEKYITEKDDPVTTSLSEKLTEGDGSASTITTSPETPTETSDIIPQTETKPVNEDATTKISASDKKTEMDSYTTVTAVELTYEENAAIIPSESSGKSIGTNADTATTESVNLIDTIITNYPTEKIIERNTDIASTTEKSTVDESIAIATSSDESLSETDPSTATTTESHDDSVSENSFTTSVGSFVSTDFSDLESSLMSETTMITESAKYSTTSDSDDNSSVEVYSTAAFPTDGISTEIPTSQVPNGLNSTSGSDSICTVCKSCTNSYIDRVLSDVTAALPTFLELPNRQGSFQLYHGKLFGLQTLERSEEAEVFCDSNDTYFVMVPLRLSNVKAFYKWQMEMPLRTFYGDINVTATYAESRVFYLHSGGVSMVEDLRITALDGIRTEFSGLRPFNALFSGLTRFAIAVFRRSFTRAMENSLIEAINKELQDVKKYEEYYFIKE